MTGSEIGQRDRAAIFCRKSTLKSGDEESRSVDLQRQNGRADAECIGCEVPADLIFIDDAVSGADTKRLRNRQRLIDLIESGELRAFLMTAR